MKTLKKLSTRTGTLLMETAFFFSSIVGGLLSFAKPALAQDCDPQGGLGAGAECSRPDDVPSDLFGPDGIFRTIANVLIFLVGAIAVIMLIVGGILYTTSGGNDQRVSSAKNTIMYAIIGIVVAFLAFAAVNFVIEQLNQ